MDYRQHKLPVLGAMAVILVLVLVLRKVAIKPTVLLIRICTILRSCDVEHQALARVDEGEAIQYRKSRNEWTFRSA